MGFSEKVQISDLELMEGNKKWVIGGIPLRAPLKPIHTKPVEQGREEADDNCEDCSSTPTGEESRIPARVTCPPPPPRKRKASLMCNYGVREFFNPPDLEAVFVRHVDQRAV